MADPTPAFVDSLHLVSTIATTPAEANKLDGISDAPVSMTSDTVDGNYLGGGGWKRTIPTLKGFEISLSGHHMPELASHQLLESLFLSGGTGYFLIVKDPDGTAGNVGTRYPVRVSSFEKGRAAGDVLTMTATLVGQGAPVDF
ncbi:phage tail tube protein [Myxococcus fulvus]|uniref:phage tail tube protein n=1 Tax=Myxococcus fulvus TaxID=33 RepID=UPI003B9C32DE